MLRCLLSSRQFRGHLDNLRLSLCSRQMRARNVKFKALRRRYSMQDSLIFDIGCHRGEDSDFYLKKGFRVIAVEANPALCRELKQKFADQIADGRFVIVEKAIAEQAGEVEFFVNEKASIWGTIRAEMVKRNQYSGAMFTKIVVPAITFASLVEQFGIPYYLKIDI